MGGVYEYIFNSCIFYAANMHIVWKRVCQKAVTLCCKGLADFCTYFMRCKILIWKISGKGIKFQPSNNHLRVTDTKNSYESSRIFCEWYRWSHSTFVPAGPVVHYMSFHFLPFFKMLCTAFFYHFYWHNTLMELYHYNICSLSATGYHLQAISSRRGTPDTELN